MADEFLTRFDAGDRQDMTQVVIMGQRGVGKTSLVRRFLFNKFSHAYTETIEDDQRQVIFYNNLTMDVTVLDTTGRCQDTVRRRNAIINGKIFLLVYSVDNHDSFRDVKDICAEIVSAKGRDNLPSMILVGNKKDKVDESAVDATEVGKIVGVCSRHIQQIETSAKDRTNVVSLFDEVVRLLRVISSDEEDNYA